MPINTTCAMAVLEHPGANAPNGWTKIPNEDMIARRVTFAEVERLRLNNKKLITLRVFRENPGGSQATDLHFEQNESYSFVRDTLTGSLIVVRYHGASGQGAGATRVELDPTDPALDTSEAWPKELGQFPAQGMAYQNAGVTQSKVNTALAIDPATIPLG